MARVLIVDDEQSIRTTLGSFVEMDGHEVSLASNAAEAFDLLRAEPFDVVITDIILPRKTGVVLLGEIREAQPDVQVIIITGEPEVGTAAEAVRKGAFDYLSKPISREDITRTISAATSRKALLDENRLLEEENRKHREHLEELVTERTRQLEELSDQLHIVTEHSADHIMLLDLDAKIRFMNRPIPNLIEGDVLGRSLCDFGPPEFCQALIDCLKRVRKTGKQDWYESSYCTREGETRYVSVRVGPVVCSGEVVTFVSSSSDITERKLAEERTKHLLEQQVAINELALELGNILDIDHIYELIYRHVSVLMDAKSFIISFYDEEEQLLRAGCALFEKKALDVSTLPPIPVAKEGQGTQSQVIHTGEPLYVPDYRKARKKGSTEYTVGPTGALKKGPPPEEEQDITRSALFVPLKLAGKVMGVMQVQSRRLDGYTADDLTLLSGLANVTAVAIANSRLVQEIHDTLEGTVHIVGDTVEIRDPYTAGHQRRVTELACAIGTELNLPEETIEGLRRAGLLHDIGKMAVPAEILSKPTRLTKIEFTLIQSHPQVAYDLLKHIHFQRPVAQIVLQHHERIDGSGYPNGINGEEILLEARILAVADTVEAMAAHRPYRPALGIDAALEEIAKNKGRLYSEDVVDACLTLFAEDRFKFEN